LGPTFSQPHTTTKFLFASPPHAGIVEVAVPKILILIELVRFWLDVPAPRTGDGRVFVE
jgi:hypothetical protein